ncbi:MAG: ABC transporter ATP-binding protein [Chthoniobacterales bacterium]|nr:ABC transporter ATP-binding protein [Chthoniobacterales bacterium]
MIAITIENLVKTFGDTVALNGINLRVEPGELFFLLGPSGCGKTTLLRNIAGFYIPDHGKILFDREDVTKLPPHKRNTGMMFQSYALWPHMTVAKNVAFGLEERRIPSAQIRERVAAALGSVQMSPYADRKIAQLSGGQQQRVALARALVIRPRCLLLDEPLSNLDAKLRLEMRTEIRRVCKEFGLTAIYVTHDQKEALSISDRMAILEGGHIAQIGTPEDVYRRPRSKIVADFIGETNFLTGKVCAASTGRAVVEIPGSGKFEGIVGDPNWLPKPGEDATLSIRPESWILEEKAAEKNSLRGRIGESTYLGEVAQYQFLTAEMKLKVFELNPRLSARTSARDLHAVASPEDVVVLRR